MKRHVVVNRRLLAFVATVAVVGPAFADAIAIIVPPERFERTFGDVRIEVGAPRDPDGLPGWPILYVGGKRIATYAGLLAQEVIPSPDGKYFLLLSNLGLSAYAAAVIDREGKVILSERHNSIPAEGGLHYCRASVTNLREWVDLKDARARFIVDTEGRLMSVAIKGCDGRDVVLSGGR